MSGLTLPADALTNREFLIWLHKLQTFRRARKPDGSYYSAEGYFRKLSAWWDPLLLQENRRTSLRLSKLPCLACTEPLAPNSTGDHIIPLARGGPQGADNYLPLCGRCNASKGTKDLLQWWCIHLARSAADLPDDVLCSYSRLMYRYCSDADTLDSVAGPEVTTALVIEQVIYSLPPEAGRYFAGLARYSPLFGEFHPPRAAS